MPHKIEWVEPEVFLTHKSTVVYHTYKHDEIESGPNGYWYTMSTTCGYDECDCLANPCKMSFDVRELLNWVEPPHPPYLTKSIPDEDRDKIVMAWDTYRGDKVEEKAIEATIKEAIDKEILSKEGVRAEKKAAS